MVSLAAGREGILFCCLPWPTPSTAADVFRPDSAIGCCRPLDHAYGRCCEKRRIAGVTATRKPRSPGL